MTEPDQKLQATRQYWDQAAEQFDKEPDHGLRDPAVRQAWTGLLQSTLPPLASGRALDIGCGTGSLSLVLAGLGWEVTGIDLSPEMIARASAKAIQAGFAIPFQVMDAASPVLPAGHFHALVCRHLLWALPDPGQVLRRWAKLLAPDGRLLLIEGFWHTGAGLHAQAILAMLPAELEKVSVQNLSDEPGLWGGPVDDERYAILLRKSG